MKAADPRVETLRVAVASATSPVSLWLLLAGFCRLRAGEIASLRADALAEDLPVVDVAGSSGRERTVPMPVAVRALVLDVADGPGPVFRTSSGRPVSVQEITRRVSEHLHVECGSELTLRQLRGLCTPVHAVALRDPHLVGDFIAGPAAPSRWTTL